MAVGKIRIEWEEDGCWLHLDTEFGESMHLLKIEDPEQFYDTTKAAILPWLRERDQARTIGANIGAFHCDPDESGGYDRSDPKHPDWHSVHADIWDAREGK